MCTMYNLVGADHSKALQNFRCDCMAAWKKSKPVMPIRVEIPVEARRVLQWWWQNTLETGEAGNEFVNVCETPAPKSTRPGVTYKKFSQLLLFAVSSQQKSEDDDYIYDDEITFAAICGQGCRACYVSHY